MNFPVLGAWVVVEYRPDDIVVTRRNPYYWKVDEAGNQLPYLNQVHYRLSTWADRDVRAAAGSGDYSNLEQPENYVEALKRSAADDEPARLEFGPRTRLLTAAELLGQALQLIDDAFDIALTRGVAVGFHLDDSMFWRGRRDLVEDPRNVERAAWNGLPSTERRLDWGPVPARLAPQMCLNSPAIEAEVRRRGHDVIGAAIARGLDRLRVAGREDLFAGVIVGWETHIGRDFADPRAPLGFCALTNLGLRPVASTEAMDQARIDVVQRFITFWSQAVADAGVPPTRIYAHIAFTPRRNFEARQAGTTYAQFTNFATVETAFGPARRAGFSTYPTPGLLEDIHEAVQERGGVPWASAEGANVNLAGAVLPRGDTGSGMSMETYLARHFNHGAALVNIFGWGLGESDNPFRRAAEQDEAIAAYRTFLRGDALVEGPPTILDRLPAKMRRIQAEMPGWIAGRREREARARPHFAALTAALEANDLSRAEDEADALLALLDER